MMADKPFIPSGWPPSQEDIEQAKKAKQTLVPVWTPLPSQHAPRLRTFFRSVAAAVGAVLGVRAILKVVDDGSSAVIGTPDQRYRLTFVRRKDDAANMTLLISQAGGRVLDSVSLRYHQTLLRLGERTCAYAAAVIAHDLGRRHPG